MGQIPRRGGILRFFQEGLIEEERNGCRKEVTAETVLAACYAAVPFSQLTVAARGPGSSPIRMACVCQPLWAFSRYP